MRTLITGITGSIGADLAPALRDQGHEVRGFTRDARRVRVTVDDVVEGDATTGRGLDAALDGVDVAYYLIHSMEGAAGGAFPEQERRGAERFAAAAPANRSAARRSRSANGSSASAAVSMEWIR